MVQTPNLSTQLFSLGEKEKRNLLTYSNRDFDLKPLLWLGDQWNAVVVVVFHRRLIAVIARLSKRAGGDKAIKLRRITSWVFSLVVVQQYVCETSMSVLYTRWVEFAREKPVKKKRNNKKWRIELRVEGIVSLGRIDHFWVTKEKDIHQTGSYSLYG